MTPFLKQVASLFAGHGDLSRTCFVFPNRRSSLFFLRYLGSGMGRTFIAPRTVTIGDLFTELSGLRAVDKIDALWMLYQQYLDIQREREVPEADSFDKFIYWGDVILSDFDDVDKYLVDASKLFRNIKDLKDLSVDYDFLSSEQKSAIARFCEGFRPEEALSDNARDKKRLFMQTWDLLNPLYDAFRHHLLETGQGYEGMIYRNVAENPDLNALKSRYDLVVFVGLNALNECEKKLLDAIAREGFGDFYWDCIGPMVTDTANKASRFILENVRRYPSRHSLPGSDEPLPKQHIRVIKVPSGVGQTRCAASILEEIHRNGQSSDWVDTSVVLPDESLLLPMLGCIPECVDRINVTMGYSLYSSQVSGFFSIVEHLQTNARERDGKWSFYHSDVLDMLRHPYFVSVSDPEWRAGVIREIVEKNRIFVSDSFLQEGCDTAAIIFQPVKDSARIPDYQKSVISAIQAEQSPVDREFLFGYWKAIVSLQKSGMDLTAIQPRTYYKILERYVALLSIPYAGEPLSGLQIMGPLETRALDFKNVIMLSVAEGTFPSKNVSASLIPYNLRVGFGLPTYEFQDSIWAYHFYRGICRAENVCLLYDSRTEGLQRGEESRYIKQLRYIYGADIEELTASYSLEAPKNDDLPSAVEKTDLVLKELTDRFIKGTGVFSASSLNDYIGCPMMYYYKHVKGIKEDDEVVEELDSSLFGSVYHRVMQELYKDFKGRVIRKEDLDAMARNQKRLSALVDDAFSDCAGITVVEGVNLLLKEMIINYVCRTLAVDGSLAPISLVDVESPLNMDYRLAGNDARVRFFGMADRLDSIKNGVTRVVDYKTGTVGKRGSCDDVDTLFNSDLGDERPSIGFQLYFYAMLMTLGDKSSKNVLYEPCIYSLREIYTQVPEATAIPIENIEAFHKRLTDLVEEIFDPDVPFESRKQTGPCEYCQFRCLCGK